MHFCEMGGGAPQAKNQVYRSVAAIETGRGGGGEVEGETASHAGFAASRRQAPITASRLHGFR